MRAVLTEALASAQLVDQAKKALMYGKDKPQLAAFREEVMSRPQVLNYAEEYDAVDLADGLKRLHAALGIRTEADELLVHESARMHGRQVPDKDLLDELGDLAWYSQLYLNWLGVSVGDVIRANVAKLLARFGGLKFSETKAQNPDKAAEAVAQAGVGSASRWFIGSDQSSHEYLVPFTHQAEWDAWCDLPEDDERSWEAPEWAHRLDGGRLTFEAPMMNGEPLP